MARPSKLMLLMALTVMAVEAKRNLSSPFYRHMHLDCCGNGPSGLSQQHEQQQQQRDAGAARARHKERARENWDDFMSEIYGENWDDEDSSRHLDAAHCMQWAVFRKDVPKLKNFPNAGEKELGHTGCLSALVREAIMGSLGKKTFEWEEKIKKYSVLQVGHAAKHRSEGNGISVTVRTWEPLLCQAIAKESSKACQVRIYAADEFAKLRKSTAMPNRKGPLDFTDKIAKSIESGPLWYLAPGVGKSFKSSFSSTWDDNFKLKLGIRHDTGMNEPKRLLSMVVGTSKAESLLQHLERNTHSLLNRYLSMVRVKVLGEEKYVLLMTDASYGEDSRIRKLKKSGSRLIYTRYDLKGKSRDQDAQAKPDKKFTLLNGDFKVKEKNNLDLTKDQCKLLHQSVRADTAFLEKHDLIDYSLFVGVTNGETGGCSATPGAPFCFEATKSLTYTFSIIDYINYYNFGKSVENFWKGGKFDEYAKGINKFVGEICPGRLEWYERTAFRSWCAIIIFILVAVAGGTGFWYWRNLQGSDGAPMKQPVQQVPWQQAPPPTQYSAPPTTQYSAGDDFGIASGQPQGYVRHHGMGVAPFANGGFGI